MKILVLQLGKRKLFFPFLILDYYFFKNYIFNKEFFLISVRKLDLIWIVVQLLNCVQLFATPWTIAHQVPLSMEFSRQEYQSGLSFPSPGDLPNPGTEPGSPTLQADSLSEPNIDLCPLLVYPLLTQILELKLSFQRPL